MHNDFHAFCENYAVAQTRKRASKSGMFTAQYPSMQSSLREFIRTELETAITFASVALDSGTEQKRQRNRKNARKAYDTALRFWRDDAFGQQPAPYGLLDRLGRCRHLLLQLGETIEPE